MKKVTILLLIFLCLLFNTIRLKPVFAVTTNFKEGIYNFTDFDVSSGNTYTIKNVSTKDRVRILIYDEDNKDIQSIKLEPDSMEVNSIIQPNYIIVVVGNGEVTITPKLWPMNLM